MPGESAELDGLVAHDGAPTTVELPAEAAVLDGPDILKDLVYTDAGRWYVYGPADYALAIAREELGLAADAPVPLDVYTAFGREGEEALFAKKRVWLGASGTNPIMPRATVDGSPMTDALVVPRGPDVYLSVSAGEGDRVSWLSSVGTLFQDDVATSFLRVLPEDRAEGELAVVIRDAHGGVAWQVWPIRAETVER